MEDTIQLNTKYYAVLIDADNVSSKYAHSIFEELSKYGVAAVKRIYGDWSQPLLKKWKDVLPELALTPIQQFGYISKKNATDIALIIDAMDMLYNQKLDGFCIISSDSDFTRLITRLKESSKHVIGMGEEKTPESFVASCSKFILLENIYEPDVDDSDNSKPNKTVKVKPKKLDRRTRLFIKNTIYELGDDEGWAHLSIIGKMLTDSRPDFDPRSYGARQLSHLFKDNPRDFEVKKDELGKNYLIRVK